MEYTLRRSARAKRMSLKLNERGELTLVLPRFVPELAGKAFVAANKSWINRQRANLIPVESYIQSELRDGDTIPFFDQKLYTIEIISSPKKNRRYTLDGEQLVLEVNVQSKGADAKYLVEKFYRDQAKVYLRERSEFFANQLGLRFNELRIKNTKTRWGSCSSQKNLNYNWRILMAPKAVVDYLVVHEVCHLKHMNHSPKFWSLVECLDPDFKEHKLWLKTNQARLFQFLT